MRWADWIVAIGLPTLMRRIEPSGKPKAMALLVSVSARVSGKAGRYSNVRLGEPERRFQPRTSPAFPLAGSLAAEKISLPSKA